MATSSDESFANALEEFEQLESTHGGAPAAEHHAKPRMQRAPAVAGSHSPTVARRLTEGCVDLTAEAARICEDACIEAASARAVEPGAKRGAEQALAHTTHTCTPTMDDASRAQAHAPGATTTTAAKRRRRASCDSQTCVQAASMSDAKGIPDKDRVKVRAQLQKHAQGILGYSEEKAKALSVEEESEMYAKSESKGEYRSLVKQEVRKERFLQRKVAAQLQLAHARARAHRIGKSHKQLGEHGFATLGLALAGVQEFSSGFLAALSAWFQAGGTPHALRTWDDVYHLLDSSWRKKHLSRKEGAAVRAAFDGNGNAQFHPYKGLRLSGFGITSHLHGLRFALDAMPELRRATAQVLGVQRRRVVPTSTPVLIAKPPSKGGFLAAHVDGGSLHMLYMLASRMCTRLPHATAANWAAELGMQTLAHVAGAQCDDPGGHTHGLLNLTPRSYLTLLSLLHPDCAHPAAPTPKATDKYKSSHDPTGFSVDVKEDPLSPDADTLHVGRFSVHGGPVFVNFFCPTLLAALNEILRLLHRAAAAGGGGGAALQPFLGTAHEDWARRCHAAGRLARLLPPTGTPGHGDATCAPTISDARICPSRRTGPYMCAWPRGWPHYVAKTGSTPRFTLTAEMSVVPRPAGPTGTPTHAHGAEMVRMLRRLDLVLGGAGGHAALLADKRLMEPFHGGIVHRVTKTELDIWPFFRGLYASDTTALRANVSRWYARAGLDIGLGADGADTAHTSASPAPGSLSSPTREGGARCPRTQAAAAEEEAKKKLVQERTLQSLTVKQPAASLIIAGERLVGSAKDVENRSRPLFKDVNWTMPFWTLIQSSAKPMAADARVVPCERLHAKVRALPAEQLPDGRVLGAVEVLGMSAVADTKPSPWVYGPYCMRLGRALEFPEPFALRGNLGFMKVPEGKLGAKNLEVLRAAGVPVESFTKQRRKPAK